MDRVHDEEVFICPEGNLAYSGSVARTEAEQSASDSIFESQGMIGSGGYSEVFKMLDKGNNKVKISAPRLFLMAQIFARKVLKPFAGLTKDEIKNESLAVIQLYSHGSPSNLVEIYSHGWLDESTGWYRIDMELCACNLEEYIRKTVVIPIEMRAVSCPGPFAAVGNREGPWRLLDIMEQICEGVKFIHANKLVHRDIKAQNVLYSPSRKLWKVTDFGTATKGTSKRALITKYARGTPSYRAPELINDGHYNNKVDIFAIGCIYWELFNDGVKAFKDDHAVVRFYSMSENIGSNEKVQTLFGSTGYKLLSRMLSLEPHQRPTSEELCFAFASIRWISFAVEYRRLGNYHLAIEAYRTATQLAIVDCTVWKDFGDICLKVDAYHEALQTYDKAVVEGYSDRGLMVEVKRTIDALQQRNSTTQDASVMQVNGRLERRRRFQRFAELWLGNREQSLCGYMKTSWWTWTMLAGLILIIWGSTLTYRMFRFGTPGLGEVLTFFLFSVSFFFTWSYMLIILECTRNAKSYWCLRQCAFDPARRWQHWSGIPIGWFPPLIWCLGLVLLFCPVLPILMMGILNMVRYLNMQFGGGGGGDSNYNSSGNFNISFYYGNDTVSCDF